MNQNENALQAYEAVLKKSPNRFNSFMEQVKLQKNRAINKKLLFILSNCQ